MSCHPRCELIDTNAAVTGIKITFTSGPAAMLQSCAPGRCGGVDIRHPAQRPENDVIGFASDLAARELMAELMRQHDEKERQDFKRIPTVRGVLRGRLVKYIKARNHAQWI